MIIGILGYGAVGISLYSELKEGNVKDVYFIADEARIKRYNEEDLIVNGNHLKPEFSSTVICDLVIVAVKCYSLLSSISTIKNHIKPNTIVLPLLNGIRSYEVLSSKLNCKVLYGVINVISNKTGSIVKCEKIINLQYGYEYNKIISNDLKEIKAIFDSANVNNNIYADMKRRIWLKWMLNMGINQMSALLDINYIQMNEEHHLNILRKIFNEVLLVAEAYNIDLSLEDVDDTIDLCVNSFDSKRYPSLALDVKNGTLGELEEFSDVLLEYASKKNIELPYNYCFNQLIKGKVSNLNK